MDIAQFAPLHEAVPPKKYGGTERVVSYLTEELVAMGHNVTLFASGDSVTSASLYAGWPQAMRLDETVVDRIGPHFMMMEELARRAHEFDILHFHMDYWPFSLFSRLGTPFVTTLHGRLNLPELNRIYATYGDVPVVSISDSQRAPLPEANYVRTVYHGLPENLLRPTHATPSYFAFLGRISPEKRPDRAIEIARARGVPLKIAAKVDKVDEDYYYAKIKPMIDQGGVEMIGEISESQKSEFLSGAHALITPIDWPEPFGLVMIEAMACGTPVIAYRHGSVPEVIDHGLTGFVVDGHDGAVAAVDQLGTLCRKKIRQRFEQRFTARRMAEDYLAVYQQLARREATAEPRRLELVG